MLRSLVALLAVTAAAAEPTTADCALDTARAVDDIMDGVVYIFASIVRCDPAADDKVRCTLDVAASIESVNKMVTIIVKAVDKCGAITTDKPDCGIAISELTRSVAGLTKASAGIVAKCPNDVNGGHPMATVGETMTVAAKTDNAVAGTATAMGGGFSNHFGQCVVNVKDSVKQLFKAVKRSMKLQGDCEGSAATPTIECVHSSIKVVDAFVGLAEYVSGAVAKCTTNIAAATTAMCSQFSDSLTRAAGDVVQASTAMAEKCEITPAERLYLDTHKPTAAPASNNGLTLALAAFLPVTAVVSFVGGRRMAKVRTTAVPLPDEEMLVQSE